MAPNFMVHFVLKDPSVETTDNPRIAPYVQTLYPGTCAQGRVHAGCRAKARPIGARSVHGYRDGKSLAGVYLGFSHRVDHSRL